MVGLTYALVDRSLHRFLVLSVLLGIGVSLQVQIARNFQASWDKQQQFYWQLYWRAPALKPNTMIVSDQEILFYTGITRRICDGRWRLSSGHSSADRRLFVQRGD